MATWLGNFVFLRNDPLRFLLDLGCIESEERLRGLDGVTTPCPFGLADPFINRWPSRCWVIERRDSIRVRIPSLSSRSWIAFWVVAC